jgi:hypothetical protein
MPLTPAIQTWLYFMQAWKIVSKFRDILDNKNIAPHWLRRDLARIPTLIEFHRHWEDYVNKATNNVQERKLLNEEGRRLLELLLHDSRYRALSWEMWRSID